MSRWLFFGVLAALMASCETSPSGPTIAPRLDMYLKTADGRQVRYDVASNGRLRFAGGQDIPFGIWSWTGSVTAAQGAALRRIVSQPHWASPIESGDDQGDNAWEITLRDGAGHHFFEVTGDSPGIDAAWVILTEAGSGRLQEDLDRLPRPDIEKLVERRRREQAEDTQ
ncbi:MAG: hypothetical protein QGI75_03345 [Phycisphaerales bacterium]|jgi:hypothetical protein|nr:hypothetical protein [Phycisphaerales bacterium]MDP6890361.1 hypothetical protein [Phycisphaerales bacterium]